VTTTAATRDDATSDLLVKDLLRTNKPAERR
jgi:hypothetical protein